MSRRIAVFGAGYIGLVTGACLAQLGHTVSVRDIVADKIAALRAGRVPIFEPGLEEMIAANRERLTFTLDADEAVAGAEIVYVCVDTPPTASGDADLSRVWAVVESLKESAHLKALVVKSTVPVGTGARIRAAMDAAGLAHVGYASNPEFTAEGSAVEDFLRPDRVVIGAFDDATSDLVAEIHEGVGGQLITMDVESAEMVKLASNAFLATRISFANEIANICETAGADVTKVLAAVGADQRLGSRYLSAGIGWGGSCFPKDSVALKALASNGGYHPQILTDVIEVNNHQRRLPVIRVKDELGTLNGKTIAVLGMTFKPGTDDMREAPSTVIVDRLLAEGARVVCWDPMAHTPETAPWSMVERAESVEQALSGAHAALLVTEWPQLREVDWQLAAGSMQSAVLFDGRNMLEPEQMADWGYTHLSVGRATARPRA